VSCSDGERERHRSWRADPVSPWPSWSSSLLRSLFCVPSLPLVHSARPSSPSAHNLDRYQALIRKHHDDLAQSIVLEQGKTFADAKGDVLRGLQVVDSMCALPQMLTGDKLEVSTDMDTYVRRSPLGVGAAICP
jgi:hypothetical protein